MESQTPLTPAADAPASGAPAPDALNANAATTPPVPRSTPAVVDATHVKLGDPTQDYAPVPLAPPPPISLLKTLPADLSRLRTRGPAVLRRLWQQERHWLWVLIPLLIAFVPTLRQAPGFWFSEDAPLWFQPFVPLLSILLVWERREAWYPYYQYLTQQFGPESKQRRGYLLPVVASGLVLLVGSLTGAFGVQIAGFVLLAVSIFYYLYGWQMLRLLWMPLAYLVVMIPPPLGILARFTFLMQQTTIGLTSAILKPFSGTVERFGSTLVTPTSTYAVGQADNGQAIVLSVFAFSLWIAMRRRISVFAALILFALAVIIATGLNVLRVATLVKLGMVIPVPVSVVLNFVIITVTLFLVSRVARYLSRYSARPAPAIPGLN